MKLLVIGAGGHAKVVVDAARVAGFRDISVAGQAGDPPELLGIPVLADPSQLEPQPFVVAIGDNATRARYFAEFRDAGFEPTRIVHPSAVISPSVTIGAGTFVAAGVVVNVDASIGENAIINTRCTIDHDCEIGDHAHIGPGSSLCGGCRVGEGSLIGVGASMAPGSNVGAWSLVGAGAVIVDDLPSNTISVGVPARVIRQVEI